MWYCHVPSSFAIKVPYCSLVRPPYQRFTDPSCGTLMYCTRLLDFRARTEPLPLLHKPQAYRYLMSTTPLACLRPCLAWCITLRNIPSVPNSVSANLNFFQKIIDGTLLYTAYEMYQQLSTFLYTFPPLRTPSSSLRLYIVSSSRVSDYNMVAISSHRSQRTNQEEGHLHVIASSWPSISY